jgi:hypothetical protein
MEEKGKRGKRGERGCCCEYGINDSPSAWPRGTCPPVIIGAMMADVSLRMTEPSSDHFSLERAVVTDYQDLRLGTSLDITGDVH